MTKRSLLVVDDEPDLVEALVKAFRIRGYDARGITDPRKVATEVRREPVDIAIVDIRMPNYGGAHVVVEIMTYRPQTMIVVMSALNDVRPVLECLRLGAVDFISKPFEPEELAARIEVNLVRPHFQQQPGVLREHLIESLWDNLGYDTGQRRGRRLEQLLVHLFESVPFFCDVRTNVRTDVEEIDLEIENTADDAFWKNCGPLIYAECKNWSTDSIPAGIQQFDHFSAALQRSALCKVGFFVSNSGFSPEFLQASKRMTGGDSLVVPVDREDLENLVQNKPREALFKEFVRRAGR